jgi:hypothetical protein
MPDALPPTARSRGPASGERVAGAVLPLAGLAIAAAATIAVFFGVGLAGLLEHPAAVVRSAPPGAAPGNPPPLPDGSQNPALAPQPAITAAPPPAAAAAPAPPPHPTAAASPPAAQPTASPPAASAPAAAPPAPVISTPAAPPSVAPPTVAPPPAVPSPPPTASTPAKPGPAPAPAASEPTIGQTPAIGQTLPPAEITALLASGDAAFRRGDLAAARLSYRRVYEAGEGRGALGIGASYDPLFLQHFHLTRAHPDPAEARAWYLRAKELGAAEAAGRLDRLAAKPSP